MSTLTFAVIEVLPRRLQALRLEMEYTATLDIDQVVAKQRGGFLSLFECTYRSTYHNRRCPRPETLSLKHSRNNDVT